MNKAALVPQTRNSDLAPASLVFPRQGILQRKCACGSHTSTGGQCEECAAKREVLQRKLAIGASNDPLEQEADRVADQVMSTPLNSAINRMPPKIQRFTGQANDGLNTAPPSVDRVLASPGRSLEPALRQDMEGRFGYDFSQVRVHTGSAAQRSAREVNANAYTVGHDIVFGAGQFVPEAGEGQRLIVHELTHVVQQSGKSRISFSENKDKVSLTDNNFQHQPTGSLSSDGDAQNSILRRQTLGERAAQIVTRVEHAIDPRTRQFISDLIESVRESPRYIGEFITGDLWDVIREHWPQILAVTLGLLAVEGIIGALGAAPTGVTQIIAAILEVIVLAVLATFVAVEVTGVVQEGIRWWTAAREANGNSQRIVDASRAFVRMVWHILMTVLALAGVRARVRGGAVGRVTAPFRETPPPTSPPQLRVIQGGNRSPVQVRDGRVVSTLRSALRSGPDRSIASARGAAEPARLPELEPAPQSPEPVVRPAPQSQADVSGVSAPQPGVQAGPALGAGVAIATRTGSAQRRDAGAYPIFWPAVFGPPSLFDVPIVFFARTPNAERDESFTLEVRRELWSRSGRDPDLLPSDYHAHHIVPLFLGGMDQARGNIMFLPSRVHLRAHTALANQPQMEVPPPPLQPLPANILRHPAGTRYELVGFK